MALPPPPPNHFHPAQNNAYNYQADYNGGGQPPVQIMDPHFDHDLSNIAHGAKVKGKKNTAGTEQKKLALVETSFEAHTIQRMSPRVGDAKSWSKVGVLKSPFDSTKVYKEALARRAKPGLDATKMYDKLLPNQQGVIDRILAKKRMEEKHPNAVWTLFDVYKVKQDERIDLFRVMRETVKLIVTLQRQDKSKASVVDKPSGSTANANKFVGEIIDLSIPLKSNKDGKGGKGNNDHDDDDGSDGGGKAGKKGKKNKQDDLNDVVDNAMGHRHNDNHYQYDGHWQQPQPHVAANDAWHGYGNDHQYPQGHNGYNGYGQHNNNGYYPEANANYNNYAQPQQQYDNQNYNIPPHAPMAPGQYENPFLPNVGSAAQYMPPTLPIDNHAYNDYSARHYSRSRSRDRPRHQSRHRSSSQRRRRHHTPSVDSSLDDDGFWSPTYTSADTQFTPPHSPDLYEEARLRRRGSKRQAYARESRTLYPDEKYVVVPVSSRREAARPLAIRTRRRPALAIVQDDYPGARRQQRAITDYPEAFDDAEFGRRGHRGEGVDFLMDPVRGGRYDDGYGRPSGARRFSTAY